MINCGFSVLVARCKTWNSHWCICRCHENEKQFTRNLDDVWFLLYGKKIFLPQSVFVCDWFNRFDVASSCSIQIQSLHNHEFQIFFSVPICIGPGHGPAHIRRRAPGRRTPVTPHAESFFFPTWFASSPSLGPGPDPDQLMLAPPYTCNGFSS